MSMTHERYTADEYEAAKHANAAEYLQSIGYELKRGKSCYTGKIHDSLVIRDDGRWFWNSRGIGGSSSVGLVKTVLMADYHYSDEITAALDAIKGLSGMRGAAYAGNGCAPLFTPIGTIESERPRFSDEPLPLPAPYKNNSRIMAYLCQTRGLDAEIVQGLIKYGKIYETAERWSKESQEFESTLYHNAVFVSYDKDKRPQSAFLRGTLANMDKPFKCEMESSDKSYPFTLLGRKESGRVFCFEAAIDAISHASYYKTTGQDWRDGHRLALGGVCLSGLERFLKDNPQVKDITVGLDNDPAGKRCGQKLRDEYAAKGYDVDFEYPNAKDWNDDLLAAREEEFELEE